jgi:hypothetical protein
LPFLTVAKTMSPLAAAGRRLRRPLIPPTAMMYRFLAPVKESSNYRQFILNKITPCLLQMCIKVSKRNV